MGVHDLFMFAEGRQLCDQTAGRIYGDRVAIENELVVAADGVAVANRPLISACECRDHFIANRGFMQRERRRAQVQDHVGALFDQTSRRFAVVKRAGEIMFRPNVLANGDTNFFSI